MMSLKLVIGIFDLQTFLLDLYINYLTAEIINLTD